MSRSHNDVLSDISNPNNSATMDDWANCNNPNNSNYVGDDDYYEHGESSGSSSLSRDSHYYESYPYKEFKGQVEESSNEKWFVTISDGDKSITSGEYDSVEDCMDDIEDLYPGCKLSYPTHTITCPPMILDPLGLFFRTGHKAQNDRTDNPVLTEIEKCDELWREMRDLLAEENFNDLEADFKYLGEEWEGWKRKNVKRITEFCQASLDERTNINRWWSEEKIKRRVVFAALQKYTDGLNLLIALRASGVENPSLIDDSRGLEVASSAFNILVKLPRLTEPNDIFSFDPLSPLGLAKDEFGNQPE